MTTWPLQRDCNAFYGDPRAKGGGADAAWARRNLVVVETPWQLYFDGKPVAGCRVHRKCAESLTRVFDRIWERCGQSQAEIDRIGMSVFAGGYHYRNMRGGRSLSMHSWGCAVDFDPARNGLGNSKPAMDRRVIEEFEREGWEWGGHWQRCDGMHFQAARTREVPKRLAKARKEAPRMAPSSLSIEDAQRTLHRLGYHEVGFVDGEWGERTEAAVRAFQRNEGLPVTGKFDKRTLDALPGAKPRKVTPRRETVSARELRKSYRPLVGVFRAKVWAAIAAIVSFVLGIIEAISEFFGEASYRLEPMREFIGDVPSWTWFMMITGVAVSMYLSNQEAEEATVKQVRRGEAAGWSDE